jgi:ribonuclease-3
MALVDPLRAPVQPHQLMPKIRTRNGDDLKYAEDLQEWAEMRLGHRFDNPALLVEALTHASATTRKNRGSVRKRRSNERLEFLGDRVIGLVLAHLLIESYPDEHEGALTHRHDAMVRRDTLAGIATQLQLADKLSVGLGQAVANNAGQPNPSILADLCEAIVGALYLDAGFEKSMAFIREQWKRPIAEMAEAPPRDAKTALQEWAQARSLPLPAYNIVKREGPPHAPVFDVEVEILEAGRALGTGTTKRAAEQAAAESLLAALTGNEA